MRTQFLTADRLRTLLDYDAETGVFTWRAGARQGKPAGCKHWTGYLFIKIDQVTHLAHRLAWLHVKGSMLEGDIDHRDLDKTNNRFTNLRPCDDRLNQGNTFRPQRNTSGHKGVTLHKQTRKWQATIARRYLGIFDCPVAAHLAYVVAADRHYGEFARPT